MLAPAGEAPEQGCAAVIERLPGLGAPAYRLAARLLASGEAAGDVVQQAYVEAIARIRSGFLPADERTWFLRVVALSARKYQRSEARRRRREATVREERTPESGAGGEMTASLRQALEALEEKYRMPVALCYEEGLSQHEAALILDVPESTLSHRLQSGLDQLRRALEKRGYAAGASAILGALSHTAPMVPAALATAIEKLVSGEAMVKGTGTAATVAAKGGIAMKVIVGVVLAGALAGGAALFLGPPTAHRLPPTGLASPPVSGPPKAEPFAFITGTDYLDGPRMEAMCMNHKGGVCDEKGNLYLLASPLGTIRCVHVDGLVETVAGDDRWNGPGVEALEEFPACYLPTQSASGGCGIGLLFVLARGSPLEGEDKGCLYTGVGKSIYRLYKNKAKGDRWWLKRFGGSGTTPPPAERGKSALVKDLAFRGQSRLPGPSMGVDPDGSACLLDGGNYYRIGDEAKGEITCLLSVTDYQDKATDLKSGKSLGAAETMARAADGTFYVGYYQKTFPDGRIFRISPDKSKVEEIVRTGGKRRCGPGIGVQFCCGGLINFAEKDCLFLGQIDGADLRRWRDGRVSDLCADGEWRETEKWQGKPWFFQVTRTRGATWSYLTYPGENMAGNPSVHKISPVDFTKPTVGPQVKGD